MRSAPAFILIPACAVLGACFEAPRPLDPGQPQRPEAWRYDAGAPFHAFLPSRLQDARSPDPRSLARSICNGLAAELEFIALETPRRNELDRIAFTCRVSDRGSSTSLDFGDLVREQPASM